MVFGISRRKGIPATYPAIHSTGDGFSNLGLPNHYQTKKILCAISWVDQQ